MVYEDCKIRSDGLFQIVGLKILAFVFSGKVLKHPAFSFVLVLQMLLNSSVLQAANEHNPEPAVKEPQNMSLVSVAPELVIIDAYPDGDAWTRNTLTGNWGGKRQELADKGVFINMDLTQVVQGFTGGLGGATRYTGSTDLWLNFDTGRLGWWPGGLITLHTEALWGNSDPISTNSFTGAISPVNFDATMPVFDKNSIAQSEFYLTQAFSEHFAVMLGQIDGTSLADQNVFANSGRAQFLNGALNNNLMIGMYAPYTAFTLASLFTFSEDISFALAAMSPGGNATSPFKHFFKDVTIASELDVAVKPASLPGNLRLGVFWTSQQKINTDNNPRFVIKGLVNDAELPKSSSNWMINFNFDQYLYLSDPQFPGHRLHSNRLRSEPMGIGLFGRFGYGGSSGNVINLFGNFGIGGRGLIPGRENDRYGVGWYFMGFPDSFKTVARLDAESGVEAFYNFAITPWAQLTADVQWIDTAQEAADDAWVFGGRLQLYF